MTYILEAAALGCQVTADHFLTQLTLGLSDCFSLIRIGSGGGRASPGLLKDPFLMLPGLGASQYAPLMSKALG